MTPLCLPLVRGEYSKSSDFYLRTSNFAILSRMKPTMIYIGADHAGYKLKEKVEKWLIKEGYCVEDLSPAFKKGDDYPKVGFKVAKVVVKEKDARGVLICGSGVGVAMAANRVKGARAAFVHDPKEVKMARVDEDANILTLSGWNMNLKKAQSLLKPFLTTKFSKAVRHKRRIKQLDALK